MTAFVTRDDAKKPIKRALGSLNQPTIIQLTVGLSHEYVSALRNEYLSSVKAAANHRLESRFRAQMYNWPTFVDGLRDLRQISEFPVEISGPEHILLNDDAASNALFELVLDRYDEPEVPDLDRFADESAFCTDDENGEFTIQPDDVTSAAEPMYRDRYPTPNLAGMRYAGASCAFNRRACIQTQVETCERLPLQCGHSCYSLGQQRRRSTASATDDDDGSSLRYCPPCQRYVKVRKERKKERKKDRRKEGKREREKERRKKRSKERRKSKNKQKKE